MTLNEAFDGVAEMLAGLAPAKLLEITPPVAMHERVEELVNLKKEGQISEEEAVELERYLALDLLISLAKVRARRLLAA